ncbi:MAG TPA: glutathione S-transferase family protein [Myxococcota bacterium]|nr:glutathione S-transferase family protein [Myxococcota bacterium]
MPAPYRLFGLELSPYSVKVRSYLRYKGIPHEWVVRNLGNMAEFQKHAKLPLIPLLLAPDGSALQDSTPILELLEARFPEPSIHPPDAAAAFLSALIEEYADEWVNKPMFHYRWWYEADQDSAAERIARWNLGAMEPGAGGAPDEAVAKMSASVKQRMVPRLGFVGSSETTRPVIETSFERLVALLESHLARRPYVFGGRPAFGDFGLWGQLYNLSTDPTPGALLRARAPRVMAWIERMLEPVGQGGFEDWDALAPTLEPLLRDEVAAIFLPWSAANARALAAGEGELRVELGGRRFTQQVQKYHAKSLEALRARYRAVADRSRLDPILARTGCLEWLQGAS